MHLFVNCENHNYNVNILEEDILNNNGIIIQGDGNEELLATLSGYTKLVHLEKKYTSEPQIYVMIDINSVSELIKNMQQDLGSAKTKLATLEPDMATVKSQLASALSNIQNLNTALAEKQTIIENNANTIEQLTSALQTLEEQNLDTRIAILEQQVVIKDPDASGEDIPHTEQQGAGDQIIPPEE